MSLKARQVVAEALTSLEQVDVPHVLRDRIDQHQRNLMKLAASLLESGQDETQVREVIEGVLDSFKDELLRTIRTLRDGSHGE